MKRDRQALVLIGPHAPETWASQVAALEPHFDIVVPDVRNGDGIPGVAEELLRSLPREFCLAGFCYGGFLAFEIMRRDPGRVTRLALLNTSARADTDTVRAQRVRRIASLEAHLALKAEVDEQSRSYVAYALGHLIAPQNLQRLDVVERATQALSSIDLEQCYKQQKAIAGRQDSRGDLHRISTPTLIIAGRHDRICPPHLGQEIAKGVFKARFVELENCGHLSPIEQTTRINRALHAWFDGRSGLQDIGAMNDGRVVEVVDR